jgi:hypothetical protein
MPRNFLAKSIGLCAAALSVSLIVGCGSAGSGGSGGGTGGGGGTLPSAPTGLTAAAGNAQVALSWTASSGATGYNVKRSTTSGGPYTQIASPSATNYSDTGLTNGTTYYYVVSAVNSAGESADSTQVSATPSAPIGTTAVSVTVDALADRHTISPFVYGTNFPPTTAYITDSGTTLVRWGGNASTRYNWKNFDTNAANDFYFINRPMDSTDTVVPLYQDSVQFVTSVTGAGSSPLMTIGMLPWVAKDATSYSFSVAKYGAQCKTDPYNPDAGNGVKMDCATNITGNDPTDADAPLLDGPPANGDPAGSVYRDQWVAALATAFGNSPHFYDMDNEMDIWGGTHRDVHPNPSGYSELRDTFLKEARGVKTWDPQAVRFGPVSCCWWFYWNGANGSDKVAHGGVDFLPWWLNEVYWSDLIAGSRSLDVMDIHAYPDPPDGLSTMTLAQQQAAALRIFRDYWDPTYVSESSTINQQYTTQIQPLKTIPFRLPRLRAMLNMIYPGTPLSITEWNAAFAGESDFSTALADADAYGIFGRERVSYAARWTAPDQATPAYQALKLYRNYDGNHGGFGTTSISAAHNANPNLFSVYAALAPGGGAMTLMIVNKDPGNAASVTFTLKNFTPSAFTSYALTQTSPTLIVSAASQPWSSTQTFPPYSATLLVVAGTLPKTPAAEWDLNSDAVEAPANGSLTLAPRILSASGNATVTLQSSQFDASYTGGSSAGSGASCGTMAIQTAQVSQGASGNGQINIATAGAPSFCHFVVTATDSAGVAQTQSGWIIIGNPAASLTKSGDNQSGPAGSNLTLGVTLSPGSSGGGNSGASILFTTSAGGFGGASRAIALTNSSGVAAVTLTLPSSSGSVTVTAEGPYGLGHPVVTFSEIAQ